jgi:hypothetical protein
MRGCKVRKLVVLIAVGALVAFVLKKLRGEPAPQFANHPTVRGGPLPDLIPAPTDPTVPAAADAGPGLIAAPEDPTVPAPDPTPAAAADDEPANATPAAAGPANATPAPEPTPAAAADDEPADATPVAAEPADLPPLVPAPSDPTAVASGDRALVPDADAPAPKAAPATSGEQTWVKPVDGACPDGYPIKAKVKSGIYHQPGSVTYDRTKPDRCYPSVAAAEADGLRSPKR